LAIFFTQQILQKWFIHTKAKRYPLFIRKKTNMAVENVKIGWITLYRAAKLYEVPKAT
jgi:hypothetical protein